jgi:hypothetical protein
VQALQLPSYVGRRRFVLLHLFAAALNGDSQFFFIYRLLQIRGPVYLKYQDGILVIDCFKIAGIEKYPGATALFFCCSMTAQEPSHSESPSG